MRWIPAGDAFRSGEIPATFVRIALVNPICYNEGMVFLHSFRCVRVIGWLVFALLILLTGAGRARASLQPQETATPAVSETPSASPTVSPPVPSETPIVFSSPTGTPPDPSEPVVSLLVGLKAGQSLHDLHERISFPAYEIGLARLNVYRVDVPADQAGEIARQLAALPEVAYVEPDGVVTAQDVIPNDPAFSAQYALVNIRAPQGWDVTTGSHLVTIAIVDTGVDQTHPELAAKVLAGYDFVNNDSDPQDDNGHGTHVAGIAAALGNNGIGIAGVSWGARILPVKVLNASNTGTYSNVAAGIVWATDQGAHIINLSLGGASPSLTLENAVNYAAAHGVLMAAAAGNTGGALLYPARYAPVIAVASTNAANLRAPSSAFGPELDLSAPGVSIYSLAPGGGYATLSGTSMSAPHVSGALALLLSLPGVGPMQARSSLETTALDLDTPGWDLFTGYGLIQLDAALALALPTPTPTPTPSATLTATSPVFFLPPAVPSLSQTPPVSSWSLPGSPVVSPALSPSLSPTSLPAPGQDTPTTTPAPAASFLASSPTPTPSPSLPVMKSGRELLQPCAGLLLLLAGVLLLFWARRSRRR